MADPKIKYDIEADVKGDAEVGRLAGQLEALAKTLDGDLKNNANAAAAALRQLGDKQAAITRFVELKQGAQDAAARLLEAQAAAQKMGQTLAATETPTRSQAGQMQKLGDAVRAAKAEVLAQNLALQQARGALQQYGVSTQNLSQLQQNVKAAVGAAKLEINALVPAYAQAGQQAAASAAQQKQANAGVGKSVSDIGDQLRKIQNIAMAAAGGGFLGGLAKDALTTADAYNNLQARIKLVTGEGTLLASSFQGVGEIALRTNTDLEQTGTLFARIAEAGKSAGLGAQQAVTQSLALTETINQSVQLSGTSAESSKAAITQLIQGLQSGVLRGEEFNSVMEQSPRLAKALADGLGVTTGELRKMAEAGSLTTDVVIRSLRSQSDTIKSEFASLPPTVGRAIENLNTSWTLFVGNLDKGTGISKTVASAIDALAGNLNTVLTVAGHAAVAWGGYTLAQKLAAAGSNQSAIAIERAALAATGQGAASGRAAVSTSAHGKAAAVAAVEVASYGAATAGAGTAVAANTVQAATAAGGYRALAGTVLTAGSKFALWGTVAYEGYGILKSTGVALGEGIAKWQGYKNAEESMAEQEKKLAAATQATADAQFKQSEAMRIAKDASFGLSKEAGVLSAKFDKLVKDGDSAAEAIGKIGKDFNLGRLPGILNAAGVLDRLRADGKLTAAEFQAAWAKALDGKDLAVFETTAKAAFTGTKREAELLAQLLDAGLRESIKRAGLDFDNLKGSVSATARSAVNDTQTIIDGLDRLKAQGVDTGRALAASIGKGIETADTQKALELVKQQIEAVRAKLGETVANGLLDQAKQKSLDLKDALDKAMPGIQSVSEAMSRLGLQSTESLQLAAKSATEAFDVIKAKGREEGESYVAWQSRKQEAGRAMIERAIAANRGMADSTIISRAAMEGLEVQTDSTGRAIVRAAGEGAKAVGALGDQFRMTAEQVKALEEAQDRLMMKYTQSANYTERQIALLEKEAAAAQKVIDLENKRLNRDKEGYSLNTNGQRVVQQVETKASIYERAKSAGLTDAQAVKLSNETALPYNGPSVIAGTRPEDMDGSNWGTRLQASIDKLVLANAAQSTSTAQTKTYRVDVNDNGQSRQYTASSDADAQALANMLKGIQTASLRAS